MIGSSQFGFTKVKFCASISLNPFSEKAGLVGEGGAMDVIYLEVSKAMSNMVSLSIPVVKVGTYRLDGKTTRLVEN